MSRDCIVVGGGISGASAALLLADAGRRVTLVEKRPHVLPLVRGFDFRGLRVDTGFHYAGGLGPGGALTRLLAVLGVAPRIRTFPLDPGGFDVVEEPATGFRFAFPSGVEALRDRLREAFPAEGAAVGAYLAAVQTACASLPFLNPDAEWGDAPFGPFGETSLREFLAAHTRNERLIRLLSAHKALYGAEPEEVPFGAHAAVVGPYYESAWGIEGGGEGIALAFEAELAARGVRVFAGRAAAEFLLTPGGALAGLRLADGEVLPCGAAVVSAHPAVALRLVPGGGLRPAYRHRIARLEETPSAVMLFAESPAAARLLERSNRFLLPPEGETADGLFDPEMGLLYVTALRQSGGRAAGFLALHPAPFRCVAPWGESARGTRPEGYPHFKEEAAQGLLRRLERSYPELAGGVTAVGAATPLTFRDWTDSPGGALYGVKRRVGQANPMPPTRVEGLYLTGQAVVTPGLMGAAAAAFVTAEWILGRGTLRAALGKIG